MFGINGSEFLVLAVIALVLIKPHEAVRVAHQLRSLLARARQLSAAARTALERDLADAPSTRPAPGGANSEAAAGPTNAPKPSVVPAGEADAFTRIQELDPRAQLRDFLSAELAEWQQLGRKHFVIGEPARARPRPKTTNDTSK